MMAKQTLYPRPGQPRFYWSSVNWRLMLAVIVTAMLYPAYVAIRAQHKIVTAGQRIEAAYWRVDRAIDSGEQAMATAGLVIIGLIAALICPTRVMAA